MTDDASQASYDDDDWGPDNEDSWHQLVTMIRSVLADPDFGVESTAVDLGSSRFDPFVVDMTVLDTAAMPREVGLLVAVRLSASLKSRSSDWSIRVWITNSAPQACGELVEWLMIDRCRVAEYFGRVSTVRYQTPEEFVMNCWPTRVA